MNPLKHIDPIGLLAVFIIRIGWAKPVPVNPAYFKNPLKGMLWVAIAGPGANFLLAIASAILLKLLAVTASLWPGFLLGPIYWMTDYSVKINLLLAFFNLLPIPPLDGSRIITSLAPANTVMFFHRIEPYSIFIILALFWLGILQKVIFPITNLTYSLFVG
jgi:Zn-dependent protease